MIVQFLKDKFMTAKHNDEVIEKILKDFDKRFGRQEAYYFEKDGIKKMGHTSQFIRTFIESALFITISSTRKELGQEIVNALEKHYKTDSYDDTEFGAIFATTIDESIKIVSEITGLNEK